MNLQSLRRVHPKACTSKSLPAYAGWVGTITLIAAVLSSLFPSTRLVAASDNVNGSRCLAGIAARFHIDNPKLRLGEPLKLTAFYRNETDHDVRFKFLPPAYDSRLYYRDVQLQRQATMEMPYQEVVLRPGQVLPIADEIELRGEYGVSKPGTYTIRFYYSIGLLSGDMRMVKQYSTKFGAVDGLVAWERDAHRFTISH